MPLKTMQTMNGNLSIPAAPATAKHAVYATCRTPRGLTQTFRIGQPADWDTAIRRWDRLDVQRRTGRKPIVHTGRKQYVVDYFEVRAVDANGRGLGSDRHAVAFPVPYRICRIGG